MSYNGSSYYVRKELPIGAGGWALFIVKVASHLHHLLNYYLRPSIILLSLHVCVCCIMHTYKKYWTDINALYTTPFVHELGPGGPTRGYRAA